MSDPLAGAARGHRASLRPKLNSWRDLRNRSGIRRHPHRARPLPKPRLKDAACLERLGCRIQPHHGQLAKHKLKLKLTGAIYPANTFFRQVGLAMSAGACRSNSAWRIVKPR